MKSFEYRHIVTLEDTNLVGNVYFTRYFSWQGRCRELFLRTHAPSVLADLSVGLALVTLRCSCNFFDELRVAEEVLVSMALQRMEQNRVAMGFDFARVVPGGQALVARGEQEVACMSRAHGQLVPTQIPAALREALAEYRDIRVAPGQVVR